MDDDTPNTQAAPVQAVVQIFPREWERDFYVFGTLITEIRVVAAIDFYRREA